LLPVLFNFWSKYLIQKVPEGFEDFQTGEQVTRNVMYRDDIVLLARKKRCYGGNTERLTEIGRRCGMEINVDKARRPQSNHPQYRR
jgi:hypothetical protein